MTLTEKNRRLNQKNSPSNVKDTDKAK